MAQPGLPASNTYMHTDSRKHGLFESPKTHTWRGRAPPFFLYQFLASASSSLTSPSRSADASMTQKAEPDRL